MPTFLCCALLRLFYLSRSTVILLANDIINLIQLEIISRIMEIHQFIGQVGT